MEPNKVVAVVVTYNRIDMLTQCVNALMQQTYPCDLLIINNGSTDNTEAYLQEQATQHSRVHSHNTGANMGGAGGFHVGMRKAVEAGYDYVWIMDDDCIPNPDALEQLMIADGLLGGPKQYGFLSGVVLWKDGKECVMNRQKIVKKFYRHVELMQHSIVQISQATFVSLLFPASTIREFGLPIQDYFIWGDDIEYTHRIAIRGGKECYLVGKSIVVHATGNNVGSDIATDDISRLNRYELAYRNEAYTYRQEGLYGICFYFARCGRGLYRILTKAKDHKRKRLVALGKGICNGVRFHPTVVDKL